MSQQRSPARASHSTAIAVRLVAFFVAALGVAAIPATLFVASLGGLTSQGALLAVAGATLLVVVAAFAAQSVDPLRG